VFTTLAENLYKQDLFKPKLNADYDLELFLYHVMKGMKDEDIDVILNNYIVARDQRSVQIDAIYREICGSTL
jgi:hypothetical protein